MDNRIENLHVISEDEIISPNEVKASLPLSEAAVSTVMKGQHDVFNVLTGKDHRLLVVVGPCSVHDMEAAKEYAKRLKTLSEKVGDTLLIVMRTYFEKPRTTVGWQGFINDPNLDGSFDIETGLREARKLLLEVNELGMPTAGEALDLITPQYIQDLISWTAIGARTVESQNHRKMASGFTSAVGFKNSTNGDVSLAINAILSSSRPNNFLSVSPDGKTAVVRTKGNPYCHVVLRGGKTGPNFDAEHIKEIETQLSSKELPLNIMVDCSHANSGKKHDQQHVVLDDIISQIENGNNSICGVMIESNINEGNQSIPENHCDLEYGVSITDACIDWKETEKLLLKTAEKLRGVLQKRVRR